MGSTSPEGLGMMGPKSSTMSLPSNVMFDWLSSSCLMHHCLLAPLVDIPVDIPLSTSGAEATTFFLLRGPCHCCSCSIQQWVSAGRHVPPSLNDNDCGTWGVVQSKWTTCHSHGTSLFPWQQQLLLGRRIGGRSLRLWCRANDGLAGLTFKLK
jgi:hypothetical protein